MSKYFKKGVSSTAIADSGSFFTTDTVEGALQQIATNMLVATDDVPTIPATIWETIKWNGLGDSITASGTTLTSYMAYVKALLGIGTIRNYGVNGTTIAYSETAAENGECMSTRYAAMDNDADYITVMGGTNDAGYEVTIGTIADDDNTTFYGACHVLFAGLIAKYPGKSIGVLIPPQNQSSVTNTALTPYIVALKEVAAFYSLPVLDLFNGGNFPSTVAAFNTVYMSDATHPNAAGLAILAKTIAPFLSRF